MKTSFWIILKQRFQKILNMSRKWKVVCKLWKKSSTIALFKTYFDRKMSNSENYTGKVMSKSENYTSKVSKWARVNWHNRYHIDVIFSFLKYSKLCIYIGMCEDREGTTLNSNAKIYKTRRSISCLSLGMLIKWNVNHFESWTPVTSICLW